MKVFQNNNPCSALLPSVKTVGIMIIQKPANTSLMTNDHRHRLIRYSEVLLWYAEAQARADGTPNAMAYECINQVRERPV